MQLMTKREIKSLLEESKTCGIPVEMPWNYIAKYNKDGVWHMESMDTDNPYSFDGDMYEILDMYSDLWRISEITYMFLLMTSFPLKSFFTEKRFSFLRVQLLNLVSSTVRDKG